MQSRHQPHRSSKGKELLVVLSSPSGGGKTTVSERILKKQRGYVRSVSVTTRKRRKGEKQGKDYLFVTEEEFRRKIRRREFVEWAWVHGHRYGTLKESLNKAKSEGRVALFVLDVQGGMAMKKKYPRSVLIFILPPSATELRRRLTGRGTEDMPELEGRLKTALKEMNFWSKYDYVVVNKNLKLTVGWVEKIIESEKLKAGRFDFARWSRDESTGSRLRP